MSRNSSLCDDNQFVGYVSYVRPSDVRIHFPTSILMQKFQYNGQLFDGGTVGSYVIIEGSQTAFLAKIYEATLPEKERMSLTETAFKEETNLHPFALADVQLVIDMYDTENISKGVGTYPEVGSKVYACPPDTLNSLLGDQKYGGEKLPSMQIATLPPSDHNRVGLSPNILFTRHCAVVGTTGGGKSYTVSKLVQGMVEGSYNSKIVILDATGEYNFPKAITTEVNFAENDFIDYQSLQLSDLVALFKPAGQTQLPSLDDAIRTLRMLGHSPSRALVDADVIERVGVELLEKSNKSKSNFLSAFNKHSKDFDKAGAPFDIRGLPSQIFLDCVWDNGTSWGNANVNMQGNNSSLMLRIRAKLNSPEWNGIFGFNQYELSDDDRGQLKNFAKTFEDFFKSTDQQILRIRLDNIPAQENLHAVVVNKIGNILLERSKSNDDFKSKPVITIIDEAHRFLNVTIKDEYAIESKLEAFERIAKETRKHGLYLTIATQRPRDIPPDVLSQMGTFIVHRLINDADKSSIINAAPEGSQRTLSFISSLSAGEALILSVELASPMVVKFDLSDGDWKPTSETPLFKKN